MYLGIRVSFAVIAMLGEAWFFVFNAFVHEIKPIAREVMEEVIVDAAHLLAELALLAGSLLIFAVLAVVMLSTRKIRLFAVAANEARRDE